VTADKGKQKAAVADTEAPSGGKDVTTLTAAPQPRVKVEPPSVENVVRYPIEVFVSTGEPFVHPERKCCTLIHPSLFALVNSAFLITDLLLYGHSRLHWLPQKSGLSGRTSVSDRRTFTGLHQTCR